MDRLTKSVLSFSAREMWHFENFAKFYVKEVVRRYGVPSLCIVSYKDSHFISHFLGVCHKNLEKSCI